MDFSFYFFWDPDPQFNSAPVLSPLLTTDRLHSLLAPPHPIQCFFFQCPHDGCSPYERQTNERVNRWKLRVDGGARNEFPTSAPTSSLPSMDHKNKSSASCSTAHDSTPLLLQHTTQPPHATRHTHATTSLAPSYLSIHATFAPPHSTSRIQITSYCHAAMLPCINTKRHPTPTSSHSYKLQTTN